MAYKKLSPYKPQNPPQMKESERQWVQDELRRLENVLQAIIAAIEELRAKVP
ncbi:hypothetical protein GGR34_000732 [Microvirga flocculans]|uniref:Uncharacterized protein n=1 Tax=Microvirga flocculans TaxID=217168 RepID=A0A7W6ICT3_9HYPH|nr:hypothetical protein [Microvirga flocculans]